MGKSLSSDSARGRSEKQQEEASRRAAPDARERIPTAAAERLGPIISTVHTNDLTLTRNKGLLVSPFLELFWDRSGFLDPRWRRVPADRLAHG